MRIVIDLQAAQGRSRFRGIGRYSISLAKAMVRNRGDHEIIIALNGLLPESIEFIRAEFDGLLPQSNIVIWQAIAPLYPAGDNPAHSLNKQVSELLRNNFLASLQPDIVHITNLMDGWDEDVVTSVNEENKSFLTAVTFYDVIPLMNPQTYLVDPAVSRYYHEKINNLKRADILLAISKSSSEEAIDYLEVNHLKVFNIMSATEDYFQPLYLSNTTEQLIHQKFGLIHPFIMYSGATDERKNHLRLIKAFSLLPIDVRKSHQLILVGHLPNEHREKFEMYIKLCGLQKSDVLITGRVSDDEMVQLYNLCKLFVFPSWHEGFGLPALEAMACGAAVIGSNTSSIPEVIGRVDALFDPFDEQSIMLKILEVLNNDKLRADLASHGLRQARKFSWDESARRALKAFEDSYAVHKPTIREESSKQIITSKLIEKIIKLENKLINEIDLKKLAGVIAHNHPKNSEKQLFIDVSELAHRDSKTGIQRVVRSIVAELIANPPAGYRVEPVYVIEHITNYYCYARKFKQNFSGDYTELAEDTPIELANGDIFIGLDLQHHVVMQQEPFYRYMKQMGVQVHFVIYDLLPVLLPDVFPKGTADIHGKWLSVLAQADGVLCISRAVADEMLEWLNVFGPERVRPLNIGWFHLGADVSGSVPSKGLPDNAKSVFIALSKRPTFVMVGTIEPRKGQMQTLLACEQLWAQGIDINLVIVGKNGWNVDLLLEMLRNHSELGKRLFWLAGVSDEYLEKVYASSSCLIGASEGEGFGLPLIEAAQYKIPMILRDIPVFREVAGEFAYYFKNDKNPAVLATSIKEWMLLNEKNNQPKSDLMPWITWKQSTEDLLNIVLKNQWYSNWKPDNIYRFWGGDNRLGTQVGKRTGKNIESIGEAGYLIFGPYITMPVGNYNITIKGTSHVISSARMDVAVNGGSVILGESPLGEADSDGCMISLPILLNKECNDLEVRIWVSAESDIKISEIEIIPESAVEIKDITEDIGNMDNTDMAVESAEVIALESEISPISTNANKTKQSKRNKRR
ncbi:MAG: glycosyltransferase family 1 protein [Campylobacterales bacterium]|nr:glycosyltransferase family 1 protein [Campylobacterales bacterium]